MADFHRQAAILPSDLPQEQQRFGNDDTGYECKFLENWKVLRFVKFLEIDWALFEFFVYC